MTRKEALTIIRKEYLCVDRDCDIERSCGQCDLVMPSKESILEAYKMAMQALQELCEDAISRQSVLDMAYDMSEIDGEHFEDTHMVVDVDDIQELPSAEKTGHWIRVDDSKLKCSECEVVHFIAQYPSAGQINFCPNCGADMRGGEV